MLPPSPVQDINNNNNNNRRKYNLITNTNTSTNTIGKTRCCKVVLAGSNITRGLKSSNFSKYACDNLRCLQCNFKIHSFLNGQWSDSVDYMFFRNNVPNENKLVERYIFKLSYL